ncbi:MAG: trigger factor [Prevotellaceae bacterium]|jgi:trigger factor|nr:trigger factor [Prevotellaceae bacterium]
MNIIRRDVDAVNAVLTVVIEKEDYTEKVEKSLKEYRNKAKIPGFRPGMAPIGLIKKMYRKALIGEEVGKIVDEGIKKYVKDNNIHYMGDLLPSETEQTAVDFDSDERFEFVIDLGIQPDLNLTLTEKDVVTYYDMAITEEMIDEQVEIYANRSGSTVSAEEVAEKDVVKGLMAELSDGQVRENNSPIDTTLMPADIKDAGQKKLFIGAKVGDRVIFNPAKAFPDDVELSSLIGCSKEEAKKIKSDFCFEIHKISRRQKAEINQALFDAVLGKDAVTDEAAFRNKIKEYLRTFHDNESDYKFHLDVREMLFNKIKDVVFPEALLKRWLVSKDSMTKESVEKDFPQLFEYIKWQVILEQLVEKHQIEITYPEIEAYACKVTRLRLAEYGLTFVADENIISYVKPMLEKEDSLRDFYQKTLENKIMETLKNHITVKHKTISVDKFNALFEAQAS